MKIPLLCFVLLAGVMTGKAQSSNNVVLITLDGFRWQELFEGADSLLIFNKNATTNPNSATSYWHNDPKERRMLLMPFFWNNVGKTGQLIGNRNIGSRMNCDNPHWFSYPGYNEMLTGFIDRKVNSNDKIENRNVTVLEHISQQQGFEGKVAAFATWGVFPWIINENRSSIHVNAGLDSASGKISERESLLNELQLLIPNAVTERHDVFTVFFAMEYMKRQHPRVTFIGLDETDSYAHGGKYDDYLRAAHNADELIARLWKWLQSDSHYKGKTTLIITTDHGRGRGYHHPKMNWRSHGRLAFGSGEVWVAAIGPGIDSKGEVSDGDRVSLKQIASTITSLLGVPYENRKEVAGPIDSFSSSSFKTSR